MDHAIAALRTFYEVELDCITEELASGKYKRLSECPSYSAASALRNAIRELEVCYYGQRKAVTISEEMEYRGLMVGRKVTPK